MIGAEILEDFVKRQRGRRLPPYEALHVLRSVAGGVEQIHRHGEYHGDLHDRNVLVRRSGIHFEVKLLDLFARTSGKRAGRQEDVVDLARLLYDMVGGALHYAAQPREIKAICRGLRRSLILDRFRTSADLVDHLDRFEWAP